MNSTVINILEAQPTFLLEQKLPQNAISQITALIITFDLLLLATLNYIKLPELPLFDITFGKFHSTLKMIISKDFDFYTMKYQGNLKIDTPTQYISRTYTQIDNHQYKQTGIQKIQMRFELTNKFKQLISQLSKNEPFKINFGNFQQGKFKGRFSILNFKMNAQAPSQIRKEFIKIDQEPIIQNYDFNQGSFPIVYEKDLKNLVSKGKSYFNELLSYLPEYKAIDTTGKKSHLFICHDMKGGYQQETVFTNPIQKERSNSYRFNYFHQTAIFNYFSHKTISIPPKHWRQLCKKYKVKCLGTFIVEPDRITQEYYLQDQFIYKLIYLAKKYRFDGYLINIEDSVRKVDKLTRWLSNLTHTMHWEIPGSIITWYDSVSTEGAVEYQNQVNKKNKVFYSATDNFYTNYWWNDQQLKDDSKNMIKDKTIFIGNDVWGRGTYGGGQYNLYRAIDQIQKQKNENFGAALFAPGYTYQNGGQGNSPIFKANEDKLYRGVQFDQNKIKSWTPNQQNFKQQYNLDSQSDWQSRLMSQSLWLYKAKGLVKLTYTYKINEVYKKSNQTFNYKIHLKVHDSKAGTVFGSQLKQVKGYPLSQKSVKKISILVNTEQITPQTELKIIQMTTVKDVFVQGKILFSYYNPATDWILEVPYSKVAFHQDLNTYFNVGYGDYFYYKGLTTFDGYDYLSDYDMPHTSSINHPLFTDIQFDDSFIGGSSIILHQGDINLMKIQIPKQSYQFPGTYFLKIVYKNGLISSLSFSQKGGLSVSFDRISEIELNNNWKQNVYALSKQSLKTIQNAFSKTQQISLVISLPSKILLGQIYLNPDPPQPQYIENSKHQIRKPKVQLLISETFKVPTFSPEIFLTFELISHHTHEQDPNQFSERYLLVVQGTFSCFIYIQEQEGRAIGRIDQIPIMKKNNSLKIKILDLDNNFNQVHLINQDNVSIQDFTQNELGHRIHLKNF